MRVNGKYSEALVVGLRRSRLRVAFVAFAGLSTPPLVLVTDLPLPVRLLLVAACLCLALQALDRARRSVRLAVDAQGWACVDGVEGALRDPCFVAPWLTVVRWRPCGARVDATVLVLPDMLAEEDFRRLRVLLRCGGRV